jgi:hypothetical protein
LTFLLWVLTFMDERTFAARGAQRTLFTGKG